MTLQERPDGIIITISQQMLKEKGLRKWFRSFKEAMDKEDWTYWMRLGTIPKHEVLYVYLNIGNKVRYRTNFVMYWGAGWLEFNDGSSLYAKAWVVLGGPMVKAPHEFLMKGFRGFRYTEFLF